MLTQWKLEPALVLLNEIINRRPEELRALQLRVTVLMHLGRLDEAREFSAILGKLYPLDVTTNRQMKSLGLLAPTPTREFVLGILRAGGSRTSEFKTAAAYLYDHELFDECIDLCILGISAVGTTSTERQQSQSAELKHQIALALEGLGRYEEALSSHQKLLSARGTTRRARAGLARCWLELGYPERSEAILTLPTQGAGGSPFSPLLLDVFQAQGKVLESYLLYRKKPISAAVARFFGMPDITELNLASGAFKDKSALFLSEGGPGDELRLCSVYRDLSKLVGEVTITSDPRLAPMMARSFPGITFLPSERHRREVAAVVSDRTLINDANLFQLVSDQAVVVGRTKDLVCSILDTLADLRPSLDAFVTTPGARLTPVPELRAHWASQMSSNGKKKVGIAWRSMLQSVARNRHYFSVEELAPLAELRDVEFWLLQPTASEAEIEKLGKMVELRVPEGLDLISDLEGQLALVSNLDAVLSPFTTTGELAGAAGIPTVLVSAVRSTTWRATAEGRDVFSPSTFIVSDPCDVGKVGAMQEAARTLGRLL